MNQFNRKVEVEGCEFEVAGTYVPERQPPVCHDHDSPAFADPGDPPQVEQFEITVAEGDLTALLKQEIVEKITDALLEDL